MGILDACALVDFALAYNPQKIERCFERLFTGRMKRTVQAEEDYKAREHRRHDAQLVAFREERESLDLLIGALEGLQRARQRREAEEEAAGTPKP